MASSSMQGRPVVFDSQQTEIQLPVPVSDSDSVSAGEAYFLQPFLRVKLSFVLYLPDLSRGLSCPSDSLGSFRGSCSHNDDSQRDRDA